VFSLVVNALISPPTISIRFKIWCAFLFLVPLKKTSNTKRKKFTSYSPIVKTLKQDISQVHCIIGNIAYSAHENKRNSFILLNNILGGPSMNSRLNMEIREKYGFTYNIDSTYSIYSDSGLFNIYLGTDPKHIDKSIQLVLKELKKLRDKKLTSSQLKKAKQQIIGQIALSDENNCNVMLGMGKSILVYNKIDSIAETNSKINAITEDDLLNVSNEIFEPTQLSTLIFEPNKEGL